MARILYDSPYSGQNWGDRLIRPEMAEEMSRAWHPRKSGNVTLRAAKQARIEAEASHPYGPYQARAAEAQARMARKIARMDRALGLPEGFSTASAKDVQALFKELGLPPLSEAELSEEPVDVPSKRFRRPKIYRGIHGTFRLPREIRPGLHIGTQQAALDRLEQTRSYMHQGRPGGGHLITVEVRGAKRAAGTKAFPYADPSYGGTSRLLEVHSTPKLLERGIDVGVYKNVIEDPGHFSKVAVDPSKVRIRDVRTATGLPPEKPLAQQLRKEIGMSRYYGRSPYRLPSSHQPLNPERRARIAELKRKKAHEERVERFYQERDPKRRMGGASRLSDLRTAAAQRAALRQAERARIRANWLRTSEQQINLARHITKPKSLTLLNRPGMSKGISAAMALDLGLQYIIGKGREKRMMAPTKEGARLRWEAAYGEGRAM